MILKQCSSHIIGCVHWLSLCWAIQESMKRSLVTLEATKIYWNFLTCSQNVLLTLETLGILETLDSKHCKTGTQWSILTRDSFIRDWFTEVILLSVTALAGTSPVIHCWWEGCLGRRVTNHRPKGLHRITAMSNRPLLTTRTGFFLHASTWAIIVIKVITNL